MKVEECILHACKASGHCQSTLCVECACPFCDAARLALQPHHVTVAVIEAVAVTHWWEAACCCRTVTKLLLTKLSLATDSPKGN